MGGKKRAALLMPYREPDEPYLSVKYRPKPNTAGELMEHMGLKTVDEVLWILQGQEINEEEWKEL